MPESLKHRIIISTKPLKAFLESKSVKDKGSILPIGRESSEEEIVELDADDKSDSDQDDEDNSVCDCKLNHPGAPEYKRPITIHAGKPKSGMRNFLKLLDENFRRLSLDEQALEKAAGSYGSDLVRFTQRNLLRVDPKGMGVTSSNYKPILGWMHGAQMVAFYMQGYTQDV